VPTFNPGVEQHVNLGPTPTWIFTANTSATNTLRLTNEGSNVLYVGGAGVTPSNGMPVYPNARSVELSGVTATMYGCSVTVGATSVGTLAAALSAGSTAFTVGSSISTITAGTIVLLGAGNNAEPVSVKSTGGATTTTFTLGTATNYDHGASSSVSTTTLAIGQLRVTQGVL
jgi:hypothetical protein